MKGFKDYDQYDALGLAKLVQQKEVTPLELCEEAIARIEKVNPKINSVIHRMYDKARGLAKDKIPRGPFSGVPFLVKDLVDALAGEPMASGCKSYKNFIPDYDSVLMSRYKKSGMLILGKTNTPEFGLMGVTEPELFGPCRNPWNLDHTPGGSSGGSAAAIAAGIVPMASGGDGGGSIRIPAGWCGLFGLKPSRGRMPVGPDFGEIWQGATVAHVISRSVRDSAAMLDCTIGADAGAPYGIPESGTQYLREVKKDPGRLVIGFTTKSPIGTKVHSECVRAVEETAALLRGLGHMVEEKETEVDGHALAMSYFMMYYGEIAADIDALSKYLGRKVKKGDVEQLTMLLARLGRIYTAGDFVSSLREWNRASRAMAKYFGKYDLYMTPTTAVPPLKIGQTRLPFMKRKALNAILSLGAEGRLVKSGAVEQMGIDSLEHTPFTQLANLTGLPAMSVPLYWSTEGLPCGIQFVAPYADEATLFRLAGQLEKAKPWFDRVPPFHATSVLQ